MEGIPGILTDRDPLLSPRLDTVNLTLGLSSSRLA